MAKKLTVKEAKLVKAKAEGKTHVEAAKEAGYLPNATDRTIQTEVARTLNKPHVNEALNIAYEKRNVTPDRIAKITDEAMDATKTITSPTEPDREVVDHGMRLNAAKFAASMMGLGKQNEPQGSTYNFTQIINEKGDRYAD